MAQNFAPYQDVAPDITRSLSPPPKSPSPRPNGQRNATTATIPSPPTSPSYQNGNDYFNPGAGWAAEGEDARVASGGDEESRETGRFWSGRSGIDLYETSLGIRLDWEACLAYLALPPAGPALLLILEHRSDYVRFHAWQSALLFALLFVIHVIFSWSRALSWILFSGDIVLIGWLTYRAYRDAETLDRYEVPIFGPLASSILDDE